MTREVARRLNFLFLRASSATAVVVVAGMVVGACYSGGGAGTDPPTTTFYFPVGLAVSSGGNALYVVNSDFDLQWNGGTLQSYDLFAIRRDTAALINANLKGQAQDTIASGTPTNIPFVFAAAKTPCAIGAGSLASDADASLNNSAGSRIPLGEACAPPVNTAKYVRDSAVLGAFASDLQLQTSQTVTKFGNEIPVVGHRLFAPVRGNATLTWADVGADDKDFVPGIPQPDGGSNPDPSANPDASTLAGSDGIDDIFKLDCGHPSSGTPTCDAEHQTGNNGNDLPDTRHLTLPGEPFGMAQTPDGTAIAITHQTETETSLLLAGVPAVKAAPGIMATPSVDPSMQFVVDNIANGGKGITAVPHDKDSSVPPCGQAGTSPTMRCVNPAFLETSGSSAELDLLRYYDDDGSSLKRPFLEKEAVFPFSTNLAGTDSRGIVIDPTPRMQCKVNGLWPVQQCADKPARVFFANRSPPTLVLASIGGTSPVVGTTYDPDLLSFGTSNLPLPAGPSRVYLAPISNLDGNYELRVFVVNFDSSTISVYNPTSGPDLALVDTIYVGPGPFAMAFDPFSLEDVAAGAAVPHDGRYESSLNLGKRYRFAYVASFTQSYVQVIDLDETQPTFESVVFTLGSPTPPKGS